MATLYLIATPIGNLADISSRALSVLQEVAAIACEHTLLSSRLLKHYGIKTPRISYHQHNEYRSAKKILSILNSGMDVALISDAGTPGISDPGFHLTRAAHQNGHTVCSIPGASATLTALTASGLPTDRFLFEGFLPVRKGRRAKLDQIADARCTVILFESVHRITRLMEEIAERSDPGRMVAVCRELTKQHEEIIRGPIQKVCRILQEHPHLKGEFVVVIAGKDYSE